MDLDLTNFSVNRASIYILIHRKLANTDENTVKIEQRPPNPISSQCSTI